MDNSNSDVIIRINNLRKVYNLGGKVDVEALRGVSFDVKRGDFITIMGPSGCGKTTLLNLIGALDAPTEGYVEIDGQKTTDMSDLELTLLRRNKIGFIFQFYNLLPVLSAIENVELPMLISGVSKKKRRKKAEELLELVNLTERMQHKPEELSGGERQRIAIARALSNDPLIILADEPTGDLDSETGRKILAFLKQLNKEKKQTIILVTHDPETGSSGDKLITMQDGQISGMKELSDYDWL
ncbi:MAG: ABC transporter ATP-binding protein [Candidatus Hodarchaeota archaeon]